MPLKVSAVMHPDRLRDRWIASVRACIGCCALLIFALTLATSTSFAQQLDRAPAKTTYWKTNWSFSEIDVNRLLSMMNAIGIDVPIDTFGTVSVDFQVSVPLTRLRDGKAYRLEGTITSRRLRLEQLLLQEFAADVAYRDGLLELVNLRGRLSDATVPNRDPNDPESMATGSTLSGSASAQLLPLGNLKANVKADSLPIGPIDQLVMSTTSQSQREPVTGRFSGNIRLRVPIDQITDANSWNVEAELQATDVRIGASPAVSVDSGRLTLNEGKLHAEEMSIASQSSPEASVTASATVELAGRQRYEFQLRANDVSLTAISQMIAERSIVDGKVDLNAQGRGELATAGFLAVGRIASPSLAVYGVDLGLIEHEFQVSEQSLTLSPIDHRESPSEHDLSLKSVRFEYAITPQAFSIRDLTAGLFGGSVVGSGSVARDKAGTNRFNLVWQDIQPQWRGMGPNLAPISARSSGQLELSTPADSIAEAEGELQLKLSEISVGKLDVGELDLSGSVHRGEVRMSGRGQLLGGKVDMDLTAPVRDLITLSAVDPAAQPMDQGGDKKNGDAGQGDRPKTTGRATIKSMRLNELTKLFRQPALQGIDGNISAIIELLPPHSGQTDSLRQSASTWPQVGIELTAVDVVRNRRTLTRRLTAKLKTQGSDITVQSVHGIFAGGFVQAAGRWSLASQTQQLQVSMSNVDLSLAVLPFSPQNVDSIAGKLSGTMSVTGGERWRLRGSLSARDSRLFAIPTGTVRSGFRASMTPNLTRWEFHLPSIRGQLAGGRVRGSAQLTSSAIYVGAPDLSSHWQLDRVDFARVLEQASGSASSYAGGQLTGELTLGGRGVRSPGDLSGRFDAELDGTQSEAVPGLLSADQFLGVISLAQVRFNSGRMRGVIGGGAARLDEFSLSSNRVRVWAEGTIQLASGGTDLDVVISTGNFLLDNAKVVAFATQLAIQSVLPIATLIEVNRLLSNRTIHLAFTGPLTDPRVRLKPLEIIREEAARFLLREILVATSATADSF